MYVPISACLLCQPTSRIKYDLWKEARGKLNDKEKQDLEKLEEVKKNTLSIVEEVISGIRASQERVKSNLIKITTRKGEIVLRHFLDKIANWALKFREVGDVLIQYDPAHAALPWAGVRVLLMVGNLNLHSQTKSPSRSFAKILCSLSPMIVKYFERWPRELS